MMCMYAVVAEIKRTKTFAKVRAKTELSVPSFEVVIRCLKVIKQLHRMYASYLFCLVFIPSITIVFRQPLLSNKELLNVSISTTNAWQIRCHY